MSDFEIRPMTREDVGAVNDLLAAAEAVDRTEEHYSVEDVVEELENPMIDPSRDWLLVEVDGEVVGQSRLMPRAPADGAISVGVDGVVHPAHRRHGIGSHLVPLTVQRARDYVHERGADLRAVVTAHAPSTNTDLAAILEGQGLLPRRWAFVMLADLTGDHRPEAPGEPPTVPDATRCRPGRASTTTRRAPRTTSPSRGTRGSRRGARRCGPSGSRRAATSGRP